MYQYIPRERATREIDNCPHLHKAYALLFECIGLSCPTSKYLTLLFNNWTSMTNAQTRGNIPDTEDILSSATFDIYGSYQQTLANEQVSQAILFR